MPLDLPAVFSEASRAGEETPPWLRNFRAQKPTPGHRPLDTKGGPFPWETKLTTPTLISVWRRRLAFQRQPGLEVMEAFTWEKSQDAPHGYTGISQNSWIPPTEVTGTHRKKLPKNSKNILKNTQKITKEFHERLPKKSPITPKNFP